MSLSQTALPFDDIRALLKTMPSIDEEAVKTIKARNLQLLKPEGSLGRLEEIAEWLGGWQAQAPGKVTRPLVAIFAANHGVYEQNISKWPQHVTRNMVEAFAAGGAAINQICATFDLGLKVFDLALDMPTPNITREPAMDETNCAATMAFGMEAMAGGIDLLCLGDMGIGNTTIASAIYHALYGGEASDWVGPGAGADTAQIKRKIKAVEKAVALHQSKDPLEILRCLGGREIAAIAGAILGARMQNIPVILDGFVVTAAAAILHACDKTALDHCLFAHCSKETAHRRVLGNMNAQPLLDMDLCLGEGSAAALAATMVKAAAKIHEGMATFEQIGISQQ